MLATQPAHGAQICPLSPFQPLPKNVWKRAPFSVDDTHSPETTLISRNDTHSPETTPIPPKRHPFPRNDAHSPKRRSFSCSRRDVSADATRPTTPLPPTLPSPPRRRSLRAPTMPLPPMPPSPPR